MCWCVGREVLLRDVADFWGGTVTKQAEGLQFFLHFLGYFPYFYNILWDDHCLRGGKW